MGPSFQKKTDFSKEWPFSKIYTPLFMRIFSKQNTGIFKNDFVFPHRRALQYGRLAGSKVEHHEKKKFPMHSCKTRFAL